MKVSLDSNLRENAWFNRFTTEQITTPSRKFQCLYLWYSYFENAGKCEEKISCGIVFSSYDDLFYRFLQLSCFLNKILAKTLDIFV